MSCNDNNIVPSCGCPSPCDNPIACGCKIKINSECVTNTVELPCANVAKGLTLDKTLEGIDDYLCDLLELIQEVGTAITLANVGDRVRVFKGVSGTGVREFRTLESVDTDTLTIREDGDRILFEAAATTPQNLSVESNDCDVSLIDSYEDDVLTLRGLSSDDIRMNVKDGCIHLYLPTSATAPMINKLIKNPDQSSSVSNTTAETSIMGTYNGSNVFTPSEMTSTSAYKGIIRGRFSRTAFLAEQYGNNIFRMKFGGVIVGAVEMPILSGTHAFDVDFEISFVAGLTGAAQITGNVTTTSDATGEMRRYTFYPTYFSLNTTTNQALTMTIEPQDTPTVLQIFKIQLDKVK